MEGPGFLNVVPMTTTSIRGRAVSHRGLLAVMCACVVLVVGMVAASSLQPSASALVWIVDTYVIFFACLVIPGGAAGDRFGRKGVLLIGGPASAGSSATTG
jgi:MFS family permease